MQDIPLIDISEFPANGSPETVERVEQACRDVGFMYIEGHGIESDTIHRIREAVIAYFAKPGDEKLSERITRNNYRGYIPTGFFSPNSGDVSSDLYEGYKLHLEVAADDSIVGDCDLYGPNRWPARPSDFRVAVMNYWRACDQVANTLLRIIATILQIDQKRFLQLFEKPLTNMTLLHYPPQDPAVDQYGIHPHKDTDALTILAGTGVAGLMIRRRNSDVWLEAAPPDHTLIVNIGDLLELWSGGYFVSTPHKVVNTSGADRYSFPYFVVPRYDTVVDPLVPTQPGFRRESVHVGDVSREVWRTNWPDAAPTDDRFDLGTLPD